MRHILHIISIFSILAISSCKKEASSNEPAWLKQNLLAYYPFNGTVKDSSGNGLDGIISGPGKIQSTTDRKGTPGKAYAFDTVEVNANINSQYFNKDFTLSVWSQLDDISPGYPSVIRGDNFLSLQYASGVPNKISFYLYTPNGRIISAGFTTAINYNKWSHIVVTNKDGFTNFYIDGMKIGKSETARVAAGAGNETFLRFGNAIKNNEYFKGKLDDIRIYTRALNDEEVKYLFQN
jgi:hypothetical protein